jgi:hypothetical protein
VEILLHPFFGLAQIAPGCRAAALVFGDGPQLPLLLLGNPMLDTTEIPWEFSGTLWLCQT